MTMGKMLFEYAASVCLVLHGLAVDLDRIEF